MNTKYIIANIKIPLMLNDDGTYVVLSENTEMKFSSFEGELKVNDKNDASEELSNLIASLLPSDSILPSGNIFASQERFGASIVLEEVIENVPSIIRKNITFKRCTKKKATSKHSIKKNV